MTDWHIILYGIAAICGPGFLAWGLWRLEQWCEVKDAQEQQEMQERMKR